MKATVLLPDGTRFPSASRRRFILVRNNPARRNHAGWFTVRRSDSRSTVEREARPLDLIVDTQTATVESCRPPVSRTPLPRASTNRIL